MVVTSEQSGNASNNDQDRLIEKINRQMGALIFPLLKGKDLLEILLNPDGSVWEERLGQEMKLIGHMEPLHAEAFIGSVAAFYRQTITRNNPIFAGELPGNGARFEALIQPLVTAPTFTIRLPASQTFTLNDYVALGIMSKEQKKLLEEAVLNRQNILIVGGTGSGKTTLAKAVTLEIERVTPQHRLIILEDTREIQSSAQNVVALKTSDTVDMLRLLKETMRLRPDRILVGEVRGPEALALLKAWNTGHAGGISTLHANSAQAGLIRLEQLIAEASVTPMQALIGEAIDLIVFIEKTATGRKVQEIVQVKGFKDGHYVFG